MRGALAIGLFVLGCSAPPRAPIRIVSPPIAPSDDAAPGGKIRYELMFTMRWLDAAMEAPAAKVRPMLLAADGKVVAQCAPSVERGRARCEANGDSAEVTAFGLDLPPGLGPVSGRRTVVPLGGLPLWVDVEVLISGAERPHLHTIEIRRTLPAPKGLSLRRDEEPIPGHVPAYSLINGTDEAVDVLQSWVEQRWPEAGSIRFSVSCERRSRSFRRVYPQQTAAVGDTCFAVAWPKNSPKLEYKSVYLLWGAPWPVDLPADGWPGEPPKVKMRGIYRISDDLVFTRSPSAPHDQIP